jgi:hypothetical protein
MELQNQEPQEETLIAEWEQPAHVGALSGQASLKKVWLIAGSAALVFTTLAILLREFNFGLAAIVALLAGIVLQTQQKTHSLPVVVTSRQIFVGKRGYLVSDLAGFWLDTNGEAVEINLETAKPGLIPMTFLYANDSDDEARATLGKILPELQPREKKLGDKVGSYFKL